MLIKANYRLNINTSKTKYGTTCILTREIKHIVWVRSWKPTVPQFHLFRQVKLGRDLAVLSHRVICFQRNGDNSICLLSVCEWTSLALSILKRHVKSSHWSRGLALSEISCYFWFCTYKIYYILCGGFFRLDCFHAKRFTYFVVLFTHCYNVIFMFLSIFHF